MPESAIQPTMEGELQMDSDQERPLEISEVLILIKSLMFKKSPSMRQTLLLNLQQSRRYL